MRILRPDQLVIGNYYTIEPVIKGGDSIKTGRLWKVDSNTNGNIRSLTFLNVKVYYEDGSIDFTWFPAVRLDINVDNYIISEDDENNNMNMTNNHRNKRAKSRKARKTRKSRRYNR